VSVFSKKFEALLAESPMFKAMVERSQSLEARVTVLEGQVNVLASTTRSLMETVTQLVRGHTTNRKAIEELYNFVTNPDQQEDDDVPVESDESQASQEEIDAYKKTLN
jgi:uncharacterized coiled-coil protein SlyX